jgi:hypothetical protein
MCWLEPFVGKSFKPEQGEQMRMAWEGYLSSCFIFIGHLLSADTALSPMWFFFPFNPNTIIVPILQKKKWKL